MLTYILCKHEHKWDAINHFILIPCTTYSTRINYENCNEIGGECKYSSGAPCTYSDDDPSGRIPPAHFPPSYNAREVIMRGQNTFSYHSMCRKVGVHH